MDSVEAMEEFKEPDENTPIYISKYEMKKPRSVRTRPNRPGAGRPKIYTQEEISKKKLEQAKEYYANNKEHVKEYKQSYYQKNRERLLQLAKENREKQRVRINKTFLFFFYFLKI